jgi:hypothetical protein
MLKILSITLIAISILVGCAMAFALARFRIRAAVYTALFCTSLLIACMPYFTRDPRTWSDTYFSAVSLGGIPSFLIHVFPAIMVFNITRLLLKRKKH